MDNILLGIKNERYLMYMCDIFIFSLRHPRTCISVSFNSVKHILMEKLIIQVEISEFLSKTGEHSKLSKAQNSWRNKIISKQATIEAPFLILLTNLTFLQNFFTKTLSHSTRNKLEKTRVCGRILMYHNFELMRLCIGAVLCVT